MAIKVGGTSIINDDKNISNVGIVTIGGSTSGTLEVGNAAGIGLTATGDGTLSIAGTFYAFDVVTPLKIDSFSPDDGSFNNSVDTDIRITFDRAIGFNTGYVYIKEGNTIKDTFGIGSTYISRADLNKTLVIVPTTPFAKGVLGAANTITTVVDATFIDDPSFTGINTTGSNVTYKFESENIALGEAYEGGYFICAAGGTQWIVAPSTSQVTRNWYSRADSNTVAQQVSGCTGWFVPTISQLQNPGYTCRQYWDSYDNALYFSDTNPFHPSGQSASVWFGPGGPPGGSGYKTQAWRVRSFRCVTY